MNIIIDKRINELLIKSGKTQRELAEHLCISNQAISKWVRGESYPDITLLPSIASYFSTTVDYLLGRDEHDLLQWCKEVEKRYNSIRSYVKEDGLPDADYRIEEGIELLRNALKERPDCWFVAQLLASDLWQVAAMANDNLEKESALSEAQDLCIKLLTDCKEDRLRHSAKEILCLIYKEKGHTEQAIEIADSMPSATGTQDYMRTMILEGEELETQFSVSIGYFVRTLYRMVKHAKDVGSDLTVLTEKDDFRMQFSELRKALDIH